jgi:ubiquinone/menaquinone biosynthesis C-methylase UbiE
MRVLDVGTGPGYAAQQAAERGAVATGVDIADELLELARRRNHGIRFLRGDAEDLPFTARSFDALVCNFAINHVPRPRRAIAEFVRVLVPEGWVAVSAWDTPDRNRCLGILVDAVRECGVTKTPAGLDPYRFADDEELRRLLSAEQLEEVEVRSLSLAHRIEAEELWQGLLGGSVRTASLVEQQTAPTRRKVRAAAERLAEEYRDGGELAIPVSAKIARGRKQ